jgi:hypothetical protein
LDASNPGTVRCRSRRGHRLLGSRSGSNSPVKPIGHPSGTGSPLERTGYVVTAANLSAIQGRHKIPRSALGSRAQRLAPKWPAKFGCRGCEVICTVRADLLCRVSKPRGTSASRRASCHCPGPSKAAPAVPSAPWRLPPTRRGLRGIAAAQPPASVRARRSAGRGRPTLPRWALPRAYLTRRPCPFRRECCTSERSAHAGCSACGVAGDDGGPPKPLLEETIGEILEAWLDSPVEFADNECERVRLTDLRRQCLHLRGRFAQRLFLVHAIHDRQADSPGVDEFGRVTT